MIRGVLRCPKRRPRGLWITILIHLYTCDWQLGRPLEVERTVDGGPMTVGLLDYHQKHLATRNIFYKIYKISTFHGDLSFDSRKSRRSRSYPIPKKFCAWEIS